MEFSQKDKKVELDKFLHQFTQSISPSNNFYLLVEEEQVDDLKAALEFCLQRETIDALVVDSLCEALDQPGVVPMTAALLVVAICAVDDYAEHLLSENDLDELDSYRYLFEYLCNNAEELVKTLH